MVLYIDITSIQVEGRDVDDVFKTLFFNLWGNVATVEKVGWIIQWMFPVLVFSVARRYLKELIVTSWRWDEGETRSFFVRLTCKKVDVRLCASLVFVANVAPCARTRRCIAEVVAYYAMMKLHRVVRIFECDTCRVTLGPCGCFFNPRNWSEDLERYIRILFESARLRAYREQSFTEKQRQTMMLNDVLWMKQKMHWNLNGAYNTALSSKPCMH